ncbi:hypothetical protein BKA81DRAFT_432815 [Phyllosticta paracitricarpa]
MAESQEPNGDPSYRYVVNEYQKEISAICTTGLALAIAFVIIRILIRTRLQRQCSTDDYLLVLATILYCVTTGLMITGFYKGGFGRATHELSYHVLQVGIKFLIVSEVAYIATSAFVKLSVAVLQLRIIGTANTTMRRINFLSTAVNVLLSVYTFFILLFHCNPPRRAWDRDINGGHCLSKDLILTSAHVWSGVSIGLDVYYAVGLIPLIWGLQIPRAVKFSTTIILGLGIFASVATIARFKYIIGFVGNRDPLAEFGHIALWSSIEVAAGLVATSLYTFRPLLRLLPCRLGFSSNGTYDQSHLYGADPFVSSGSALHKLQPTTSLKKRDAEADAGLDLDVPPPVPVCHHNRPQHSECLSWGMAMGCRHGESVAIGAVSLGTAGASGSGDVDDSSNGHTPQNEVAVEAPRAAVAESLHRSSGNVRVPVTEQQAVNVSLGGTLNGCSESAVTAGKTGQRGTRVSKGRRIGSHNHRFGGAAADEEGPGPGKNGIWKEETVEVRTMRIETSEDDWISAESGSSSPQGY